MLHELLDRIRAWRYRTAENAFREKIGDEDAKSINLRKLRNLVCRLDPKQGHFELLYGLAVCERLPKLTKVLEAGLRPDVLGNDPWAVLHKLDLITQPVIDQLLQFTQEVNVRDIHQATPLMRAAEIIPQYPGGPWTYQELDRTVGERLKTIDKLLERGAELDLQDNEGQTALMKSVADPSIVKRLIEAGAKVDIQGTLGHTALHHCFLPRVRVRAHLQPRRCSVELLIQAGARADLTDNRGQSPADTARAVRDFDSADMLDAYASSRTALNIFGDLGSGADLQPL